MLTGCGPQPSDQPSSSQEAFMSAKAEGDTQKRQWQVSAWRGVPCPSVRSTCSKFWSSGSWVSGKPASSNATCTSFSRSTTGRRSGSTSPSKSSTGTAKLWSGYSCGTSQVRGRALLLSLLCGFTFTAILREVFIVFWKSNGAKVKIPRCQWTQQQLFRDGCVP